jgi:Flp pilus assembly protein TadG
MRSFRCRRGIAASEFAVLAPALLLIFAAAHDVASSALASIRLETAVRAGAQQAMATPADMGAIRNAVLAAAPGLTAAEVPAPVLACECAGAAAACGAPCPGGEARYVTITARRTLTPLLLTSFASGTGHAVIRVR